MFMSTPWLLNAGLQERTGDGLFGSLNRPFRREPRDAHEGGTGIHHDGADVGEVEVD